MYQIKLASVEDALMLIRDGLRPVHSKLTMDSWVYWDMAQGLMKEAQGSLWVLATVYDTYNDNDGHKVCEIVCDKDNLETIRMEAQSGYGKDIRCFSRAPGEKQVSAVERFALLRYALETVNADRRVA